MLQSCTLARPLCPDYISQNAVLPQGRTLQRRRRSPKPRLPPKGSQRKLSGSGTNTMPTNMLINVIDTLLQAGRQEKGMPTNCDVWTVQGEDWGVELALQSRCAVRIHWEVKEKMQRWKMQAACSPCARGSHIPTCSHKPGKQHTSLQRYCTHCTRFCTAP